MRQAVDTSTRELIPHNGVRLSSGEFDRHPDYADIAGQLFGIWDQMLDAGPFTVINDKPFDAAEAIRCIEYALTAMWIAQSTDAVQAWIAQDPSSRRWIERTYHRRRRQLRLGRLTPVEFETIMTTPAAQAA